MQPLLEGMPGVSSSYLQKLFYALQLGQAGQGSLHSHWHNLADQAY